MDNDDKQLGPDEQREHDEAVRTVLSALRMDEIERLQAIGRMKHDVDLLRELGVSWREIAAELHLTRQGAQQKYADSDARLVRLAALARERDLPMPGTWPLWSGNNIGPSE